MARQKGPKALARKGQHGPTRNALSRGIGALGGWENGNREFDVEFVQFFGNYGKAETR
jgi:hypothetical protein